MQVDLHADTPLWQAHLGYNLCAGHRPWLPAGAWLGNLDLPRMRAAGLNVQIFGLVTLPWEATGFASLRAMVRRLRAAEEVSAGAFALATCAAELEAAVGRGAVAGLMGLEGVHPLAGDMGRLSWCLAHGVVSFGLAHFSANAACRPARGLGRDDALGLTPFGHALVDHLAAAGALVDLTHINRTGFADVLGHAQVPVWVSHTGVAAVHPHWRNLDDGQIRAVADRGGVIGIIFSRHFLGGNDIAAVVRHLRHLMAVGGSQCAALGSDFDGFIVPVRGLADVSGRPRLAAALHAAGLAAREVDGIMGDNAYAFLRHFLKRRVKAVLPSRP